MDSQQLSYRFLKLCNETVRLPGHLDDDQRYYHHFDNWSAKVMGEAKREINIIVDTRIIDKLLLSYMKLAGFDASTMDTEDVVRWPVKNYNVPWTILAVHVLLGYTTDALEITNALVETFHVHGISQSMVQQVVAWSLPPLGLDYNVDLHDSQTRDYQIKYAASNAAKLTEKRTHTWRRIFDHLHAEKAFAHPNVAAGVVYFALYRLTEENSQGLYTILFIDAATGALAYTSPFQREQEGLGSLSRYIRKHIGTFLKKHGQPAFMICVNPWDGGEKNPSLVSVIQDSVQGLPPLSIRFCVFTADEEDVFFGRPVGPAASVTSKKQDSTDAPRSRGLPGSEIPAGTGASLKKTAVKKTGISINASDEPKIANGEIGEGGKKAFPSGKDSANNAGVKKSTAILKNARDEVSAAQKSEKPSKTSSKTGHAKSFAAKPSPVKASMVKSYPTKTLSGKPASSKTQANTPSTKSSSTSKTPPGYAFSAKTPPSKASPTKTSTTKVPSSSVSSAIVLPTETPPRIISSSKAPLNKKPAETPSKQPTPKTSTPKTSITSHPKTVTPAGQATSKGRSPKMAKMTTPKGSLGKVTPAKTSPQTVPAKSRIVQTQSSKTPVTPTTKKWASVKSPNGKPTSSKPSVTLSTESTAALSNREMATPQNKRKGEEGDGGSESKKPKTGVAPEEQTAPPIKQSSVLALSRKLSRMLRK
ncbi:hypothetical protein CKK34_1065 [Yarrowia sp. E02]|nr:hypothetical protein CKK34_1065 [Yarrowia sp. E02]